MIQDNNTVEVTLKGGGLDFHYNTSLPRAGQIIAFLSGTQEEESSSPNASSSLVPALSSKKGTYTSAIEAIRQSGARTYPQKIAALGVFILERDNRDTFDPKEILALLRRMGDLPRNFTRDLGHAEILLGYVSKEPNGEYFLTDLGREAVLSQFSNAVPASGASKKRRPKKRSGSVEVAE